MGCFDSEVSLIHEDSLSSCDFLPHRSDPQIASREQVLFSLFASLLLFVFVICVSCAGRLCVTISLRLGVSGTSRF